MVSVNIDFGARTQESGSPGLLLPRESRNQSLGSSSPGTQEFRPPTPSFPRSLESSPSPLLPQLWVQPGLSAWGRHRQPGPLDAGQRKPHLSGSLAPGIRRLPTHLSGSGQGSPGATKGSFKASLGLFPSLIPSFGLSSFVMTTAMIPELQHCPGPRPSRSDAAPPNTPILQLETWASGSFGDLGTVSGERLPRVGST